MAASIPSTNHNNRWRCVSLEENLDDVGSVILAAQATNDTSHPEQDGCVLGAGDDFSYIYRPRRTISDSHASASAAADAAAAAHPTAKPSSSMKRQLFPSPDVEGKAPPKKISRKKQHRSRFTDHPSSGDIYHQDGIQPTHLMFTQSPKAPKKVSRTKRRVLCSAIGCSNTSFHNGGLCFLHGGNHSINPINLFSPHQVQPCASVDQD